MQAAAAARPLSGRLMLWLLCAMYLLFYVDRVNIATAATSIQRELGLSNTELGLVFSAFAYPYAFFQIFGGWVADRFGPRWTLAGSGLIVAATTMLTGAAGGLGSLFAIRMALGFGEGAAFPTATRAMTLALPASMWGYAQGITHSAARLGNALTPPLIAFLIAILSWRASFVILGAASLIWVVAWTLLFHPAAPAGRTSASPPTPWRRLTVRVLPATAVDFCYGWMLWVFLNWLPSFFQNQYHLDMRQSAVHAAGVFIAGVAGDTLGGLASDLILRRTGSLQKARGWLISGALLVTFVFMTPLLVIRDVTEASISLGLAFFALELVVAPIWSVPMDIAPAHAGKASGLMNFGFGVAGIISPAMVGMIIDRTGDRTLPFIASMALLLLGAVLALRMRPDERLADETGMASSESIVNRGRGT